jgi:hypothetical protein
VSEQDDLQDLLIRSCADYFPYICTGKKTHSRDGSVSCKCGAAIWPPHKFKESEDEGV